MTKEEIMKMLDDILDDVYNNAWDEGYNEGVVAGQQELVELYGLEPNNA